MGSTAVSHVIYATIGLRKGKLVLTQCIPVVKIFALLDLEQNQAFFQGFNNPDNPCLSVSYK